MKTKGKRRKENNNDCHIRLLARDVIKVDSLDLYDNETKKKEKVEFNYVAFIFLRCNLR